MMRLLAIDAGNTRVKWALHDGEHWRQRGAVPLAQLANFKDEIKGLSFNRVVISNVAGEAIGAMLAQSLLPHAITFISSLAVQCGVTNGYSTPTQLGTDRWAALIGAHVTARNHPALVVMAGTALTIDALSAKGEFWGGVIVPGPTLMRDSLNRGTAQLPAEAGEYAVFPAKTVDAIASGAIEACAGAIERMHARLSSRAAEAPCCIASGGALELLVPRLSFPLTINDNLVLDGLLAIARSTE